MQSQKTSIKCNSIRRDSSLDTAKTMDGTSAHVMQNIFEGLYVLDDQDQPIPAVAKSLKEVKMVKIYI